nr:coproporphyrinogen dehydrogenase HemZ [Turicibacter sp.]
MSEVINIKIEGVTNELILHSMQVLNQGFYEKSLINQSDTYDLIFHFQEEIVEEDLIITGYLNHKEQVIKRKLITNSESKIRKYAYLATYLLLLQEETGRIQAWGLLNGMRPTKLVHGMKKRGFNDQEIKAFIQDEYLVSDEKIDLLLNVSNHQLKVIPDLHTIQNEVSLYIGIPFCPTRCAYCTFPAYAHGPFQKWVEPFLEALVEEIKLVGAFIKKRQLPITSIYFGGGTATTLSVEQFEKLLVTVYEHIATSKQVREITVEAGRPDTITPEKLNLLKQYDIHRISINPQSFHQKTLDEIGRHHTVEDVIEKYNMAKNYGFDNINMDLIVGLPNEGKEELAYSLEEIKRLQPESLTVHMLAFKRSSKITQNRGLYTTASKEELQEMGRMTYDFAAENDYVPYYLYRQKNISGNMENIGYSKVGQETIYN